MILRQVRFNGHRSLDAGFRQLIPASLANPGGLLIRVNLSLPPCVGSQML